MVDLQIDRARRTSIDTRRKMNMILEKLEGLFVDKESAKVEESVTKN